MSDLAAVIILWAATIACFAVIIVLALFSRDADDSDLEAETAALWAEACPWPLKDETATRMGGETTTGDGFHNQSSTPSFLAQGSGGLV